MESHPCLFRVTRKRIKYYKNIQKLDSHPNIVKPEQTVRASCTKLHVEPNLDTLHIFALMNMLKF